MERRIPFKSNDAPKISPRAKPVMAFLLLMLAEPLNRDQKYSPLLRFELFQLIHML